MSILKEISKEYNKIMNFYNFQEHSQLACLLIDVLDQTQSLA